jgi:4-amino-4-deoxy-L-arabinose transferase-like glycosyltransferase
LIRASHILLPVAIVVYAAMLWPRIGPFAGGADSAGYLGSAQLLSQGRMRAVIDRTLPGAPLEKNPPTIYMPLGFRTVGTSELAPTYPVGFPLLIAATAPLPVSLETRTAIVLLLHALAGALLTFWLARECGLSRGVAGLAAVLLATSPAYLFVSVSPMSDVPALVWTTAAVLAAWRSRGDARWALAAGAALSIAVLIRPTNAMALLPMLICAGVSPRRWLLMLAAGAPGAAFFFAYNVGAYGAPLATGYLQAERLFAVDNVVPSLRHYASWLPVVLTPIVVLALALPLFARRAGPLPVALMLWAASFAAFYAFYAYTYETWWYTRFLLPAFPPLIVGALWVARAALDRAAGNAAWQRIVAAAPHFHRAVTTALVAAAILAHNYSWGRRLDVFAPGVGEARYVTVAEWTRTNLPANAGLLALQASGALYHYTNFPVIRWDLIDGDALRSLERDAKSGAHPLYAVLFPYDFELQVRDRLQGNWTQVASVVDVTVWRFDGLTESVGAIPADQRWVASKP